MGAHHFTMYVIPSGVQPSRNSDGTYDSSFLTGYRISEDVLGRLRSLLPSPNHWGPVEEFCTSVQWGSDLRIWHDDDGQVRDVVFRYSPAGDPVELLHLFITIVKEAGCDLLVQTSFEVISPEFDRVFRTLQSHRAFRFLSDAQGVIKEAASETDQKC
jgi:hypothetical protein